MLDVIITLLPLTTYEIYLFSIPLTALVGRLVDGVLTITASEQRSQFANRKAARQRLAALLRSSLAPLPQRRASKPTRASKLQRLRDKRIRSELKAQRRRPLAD